MNSGLARLLRPNSIAVFGGIQAAEVIRQNERMGFCGEIWPVHPTRAEMAGRRAYRAVADLPGVPDAAFVGVNRHASIGIMAELADVGTGGAVAHAAGFSEAGDEGRDLQERLVRAANGMPFLGPNCYGFINYFDSALLWPDQHGGDKVERGVGIVTQSGNIGLNLTMQQRGLPIGYMITLGNQISVGLSGAIESLLDDARVTSIGLHIEAIDDATAFAAAVARAHRQKIPVIAVKTGKSDAGAALALSHTASLGGRDAVLDAFFRYCGVVRVHSLPVFLESLKLLHVHGPLWGRNIASMSCSGGEAALIADAASERNLCFRPLSAAQDAAVAATLPPLVVVSNPLDYHTFSWKNRPALTATFAAMMAADFDMTMLILDYPRADRCDDADWDVSAQAFSDAAVQTGARGAIVASLPESMPLRYADALFDKGIVPLCGLEDALAAVQAAADAGEFAKGARAAAFVQPVKPSGQTRSLAEWDGKARLAHAGVKIPAHGLARGPDEAVNIAERLGFPIVVKATGAALAHKTELGAVRLNVTTGAQIREAAEALLLYTGTLLVERMVTGVVAEIIVGITRDAVFGLCLVLGSGGILVELIGDSEHLLMPATRQDISAALRALKVSRLIDGYRGKPAGDREAAIDAILAIQHFALTHSDTLMELDVNPLMICGVGQGAIAADVLMNLQEAT
jgi:acyl-CoA synthetase (NDP forming)